MSLSRLAFWRTNRQQHEANGVLPDWRTWRASLTIRTPVLQWTLAVAMALGLGLYLLAVISWRSDWMPYFVLAAIIPFVCMMARDVRKLLLTVILFEVTLQLDKFLYYHWDAASLGAIGGLNVSLTTFCLAALYVLWTAELLAKATPVRRSLFRASLPLITYLAAVILSAVAAHAMDFAIYELFLLFQSFLIYLYLIKWVRSRQDVLFIVTVLLIGLTFQGAVMIGVGIIGHGISVARVYAFIDASGRVGGTVGTPNTAASYLTLLLAPTLGVLLTPLKGRYKWLAALAFGLGAVGLVLTFSRGGWLAGALSVTLLCLFALYRGWLSPRVFLILAIVVVLLSLLWGQSVLARLTGDDGGAAASRVPLTQLALRMIRDHPLLGIGANNFATMLEQYTTPEFYGTFLFVVHNKYLLVWAETGIVGLLAFVWFLLAHIRRGWQVWRRHDRLMSPLALGFAAAIVGQMGHMFFDVFHSRPQVQMLWLVAGLITAMRDLDGSTG